MGTTTTTHVSASRLGDALVGVACGLILILAIFGWAVFP